MRPGNCVARYSASGTRGFLIGRLPTFGLLKVRVFDQSAALHLQHNGDDLNKAYGAGSYIAQIAQYTYWLKTDTVSNTYQLMRYDGDSTDAPVVDNIVSASFEYFGDVAPPQMLSPADRTTTYGPAPPAVASRPGPVRRPSVREPVLGRVQARG